MSGAYKRNFVTLKQERNDYAMNGKQALGRCIIETKSGQCKISVHVQDLKPESIYKVYLIASDPNESLGVSFGAMYVDAKGKGTLKCELDATNILETQKSIEEFQVVSVIVPKKDDLIAVMTGFMHDEVMWKNRFVDFEDKIETKEVESEEIESEEAEAVIEVEEAEIQAEEVIEVEEAAPEIQAEAVIEVEEADPEIQAEAVIEVEEADPEIQLRFIEAEEVVAETQEVETEEKEVEAEEVHSSKAEGTTESNFKKIIEEYDELMRTLQKSNWPEREQQPKAPDVAYVFENYAELFPFEREEKKIRWVRITLKDLLLLDMDSCSYMNHPFVTAGYHRYKHLLLGEHENEEKKHYTLGIPDFYAIEYKEIAAELGFTQFRYCQSDESYAKDYGYWLKEV